MVAERPKVKVKVKGKKPVVTAKKKVDETQLELPFDEVGRSNPAETIRGLARGFRLRFHRFGQERMIDKDSKAAMLSGTDTDLDQMRLTKKLFDRHPAIRQLSSAEGAIRKYFEARTWPFPEAGVRVMILDPPANAAQMTVEDLDKYYAEQVGKFRAEMLQVIDQQYNKAMEQLQNVWDDVLNKAREKLKSQFDARQYPTRESLPTKCRCVFESYNVELSRDWKHLSPQERERELGLVRQKFEAAVARQEEFVVELLSSSISQLLESLTNVHEKKAKTFKSSVVKRVFGALDEFKKKTVKYGVLQDSAVEEVFAKLRKVMKPEGLDRAAVTDNLRRSEAFRENMIQKVQSIGQVLQRLVQSGQTRRKLRR